MTATIALPQRSIITPAGHALGWNRQRPDFRDRRFRLPAPVSVVETVSLRDREPPVYEQTTLGSCIANGLGFAYQFDLMKQGLPSYVPSRLFLYYNARLMEGDPSQDNGAQIRDGAKSLNTTGIVPETDWPYDVRQFAVQPPAALYQAAQANRSIAYAAVNQSRSAICAALAAGFPVVFGFSVYESFESEAVARTGMVPMPSPVERMLGGHCVAIVGCQNSKGVTGCYEIRNSWGPAWGDAGHCWMPMAYVEDPQLASDFWVISAVMP